MVRLGWSRRAYQVTAEHAGNGSRLPHIWLTVLPRAGGGGRHPPRLEEVNAYGNDLIQPVLFLWNIARGFASRELILWNVLLFGTQKSSAATRDYLVSGVVLREICLEHREGSPMKPTLYTLISSVRFFTLTCLLVWIFNKTMKQLFVSSFLFLRAKLIQRDLNY